MDIRRDGVGVQDTLTGGFTDTRGTRAQLPECTKGDLERLAIGPIEAQQAVLGQEADAAGNVNGQGSISSRMGNLRPISVKVEFWAVVEVVARDTGLATSLLESDSHLGQ